MRASNVRCMWPTLLTAGALLFFRASYTVPPLHGDRQHWETAA